MIIEATRGEDINARIINRYFRLQQSKDVVLIEKQQAAQLIEVLQKWLAGEEVE